MNKNNYKRSKKKKRKHDIITFKKKENTIFDLPSIQLAKKDFPLCMQHLHQNMRANHHLRHHGRQQYGLFLKGIGLTLEEAMRFWKTEFTKVIDGDKVCLFNDLRFCDVLGRVCLQP